MNILFIEDDEDKARRVTDFITNEFRSANVIEARSFNSGLKALLANKGLDLVLLDITMPTYDLVVEELGAGVQEHFAGRDLLAQMKLRGINIPTIVVTMFDTFGSEKQSLSELVKQLREKCSPIFKGLVYYNSSQETWKTELKKLIGEISAARKS